MWLFSCVQLSDPMDYSTPGFRVLHYLPKFAQIHVHWVSDAIQPSSSVASSSCPQSFPASGSFPVSLFTLCIRWPKYRSISISPSSEYSGLISFRLDWFGLLVLQGTLECFLEPQFKGINSSVLSLLCGLSHPYVTTGKAIYLTMQTFAGKVMFLLWSRLAIAFLPRSFFLLSSFNFMAAITVLISWLQSLFAVILEPKKIKSVAVSAFSLSVCHDVMEPVVTILVFWMLSFKPAF